jgi:hypothetical protein
MQHEPLLPRLQLLDAIVASEDAGPNCNPWYEHMENCLGRRRSTGTTRQPKLWTYSRNFSLLDPDFRETSITVFRSAPEESIK